MNAIDLSFQDHNILDRVESLSEARSDFTSTADLAAWFSQSQQAKSYH